MQESLFSYHLKSQKTNSVKSGFLKRIFRLLLVILAAVTFFFFLVYIFFVLISHIMFFDFFMHYFPQQNMKGVNILVFGVDATKGVKRSDSIVLFHFDLQENTVGALSVPRDTKVKVDGHGFTRINHAYAYGGTSLLVNSISTFLGLPIDHYIKVDINGLSRFIDRIGGVPLMVEKDLFYQDNAQNLEINLKKGQQNVSGDQAIEYMRFRSDSQGDIGRIERQQLLMESLAKKLTRPKFILELPVLVRTLRRLIQTDMSVKEMISLSIHFTEVFRYGNIKRATVPGAVVLENGMSFWKPDIIKMDHLIDEVLLGFDQDDSSELVVVKDFAATQDNREVLSDMDIFRITDQIDLDHFSLEGVKIEILNGYGAQGAANQAVELFRSIGCIVARVDNAASFEYEETVVVDWNRKVNNALNLAKFIDIDPSRIIVYHNYDKPIDLTLVLGKDWPKLYKRLLTNGSR